MRRSLLLGLVFFLIGHCSAEPLVSGRMQDIAIAAPILRRLSATFPGPLRRAIASGRVSFALGDSAWDEKVAAQGAGGYTDSRRLGRITLTPLWLSVAKMHARALSPALKRGLFVYLGEIVVHESAHVGQIASGETAFDPESRLQDERAAYAADYRYERAMGGIRRKILLEGLENFKDVLPPSHRAMLAKGFSAERHAPMSVRQIAFYRSRFPVSGFFRLIP